MHKTDLSLILSALSLILSALCLAVALRIGLVACAVLGAFIAGLLIGHAT